MSSKYTKKYKIPEDLEGIVDRFAREVLRNQPKDILEFAIEYFKGLEENQKLNDSHKLQDNRDAELVQEKDNNETLKQDIRTDGANNKEVLMQNGETGRDELNINSENGNPKELYENWFSRHSIDKPIAIPSQEKEALDENLRRTEIEYDIWFNKHCVKSPRQVQNGETKKDDETKAINDNKEEGKITKDEYSDWFIRHSNDKIKTEYIPEKVEVDENNRNHVDYITWFKNHSK